MAEQRDNSGALFKNDKGDNPKRPDYTGNCCIDGVEKRVSAWLKKSQNGGKTYMSLSFSDMTDQRQNPGGARSASGSRPQQRPARSSVPEQPFGDEESQLEDPPF